MFYSMTVLSSGVLRACLTLDGTPCTPRERNVCILNEIKLFYLVKSSVADLQRVRHLQVCDSQRQTLPSTTLSLSLSVFNLRL